MAERALDAMVPGLVRQVAPLGLGDWPTPVVALDGLGAELYVKRDDLSSALYGGNKVRKLEWLLGAARRAGAHTVVTMGGVGSNHLLATALHGRAHGLRTVGVVFDQPDTEAVRRNAAADRGAGVELVACGSKYALPAAVAWTMARLRLAELRPPVLIPGGGSSPLGALGFVNAGLELAGQVRAGALPEPRAVFVPYGTGGTAVGLALGLQLGGLASRVVAVRVIDRLLANRPRLEALARRVRRLLRRWAPGLALPARPAANLELRHGYIGAGYGHPTPAAEAAVAAFAERAGLRLETTYSGKAAAALLDTAASQPGPLLFWHTYSAADISTWIERGGG
jgi:D-cysteine desulfhydrase